MSVTLSELSLRNARRQAREYLIYFATVVMAAALLYAFNGLVFSQEVRSLSKGLASLPLVIVLASIVVVCIFGWLVSYATGFMLSRRSRELGSYILIGLTNRQVARLFFLENLAVGGCALALGTGLGGLLYQALRAIVLALFGLPYRFAFGFSLPALGLTAAYFALIYLRALGKSRRRIRRMKIYDLLYLDRQNQSAVVRTGKGRAALFVLSILFGLGGTLLLMAGDLTLGVIGAGCVIPALFGFYLSFASGVPAFFDRRPARKYRGQNLLIFRTLTAKLATMGIVMAVISLIFTAAIMAAGSGLVFRGIFLGRSAESACFDLYITMEGSQRDFSPYRDYIQENIPVEEAVEYQVYLTGSPRVRSYIESQTVYYAYGFDQDPVLRYSDYAALRSIAGYPAVELGEGQYLIHCMPYLEDALKAYQEPLTLGEAALTPGGIHTEGLSQVPGISPLRLEPAGDVYTERLSQGGGLTNGRGYVLVVPDEAVEGLAVHHESYAARTVQPVPDGCFYELTELMDRVWAQTGFEDHITTSAQEEAEVAAQTALIVVPMYYLALALIMTAATILTIQQLSETGRYRSQFALLRKLGMNRREMAKALGSQFAIYYALPALPPLLIGIPFIFNLAGLPEPGVMVGMNSPAAITAISLGVFAAIYAIYILLAYTSLKRDVLPA